MYCTAEDLRSNIGGLTATNTKAPEEFLEEKIKEKCAHINSMIGRRYKLPITLVDHPDAFYILKDICIELVRPAVAIKLLVATGEVNQKPETGMAAQAEKRLVAIREGKYDLPNVETCNDCQVFESGYYDDCEADGIPRDNHGTQDRFPESFPR